LQSDESQVFDPPAVVEGALYPRFIESRLTEALADAPVVLIHGPRQSGKTTLARELGRPAGYAYFSFDDDVMSAAARADPVGFVADLPERTILDEVQRVPQLFTALKSSVDRRRAPGRLLLTGSANVLLLPRLADSLAGRMAIVRLHPLAQAELSRAQPRFLDALFHGAFKAGSWPRLGKELFERIAGGGYPAALARSSSRRRTAWYRDYIETLVQRDVRDLARIRALDAVPRLIALAAGQTARLFNLTDLAAPFQQSRPTATPWGNCWRPSCFRNCSDRQAGARRRFAFSTFATKTVPKWISSSNGVRASWPASK